MTSISLAERLAEQRDVIQILDVEDPDVDRVRAGLAQLPHPVCDQCRWARHGVPTDQLRADHLASPGRLGRGGPAGDREYGRVAGGGRIPADPLAGTVEPRVAR